MAKKIGPEAKTIALFTALPEDSKRIVFDVIKSQMATPRKASTRKGKSVPATLGGSHTRPTFPMADSEKAAVASGD